MSSEMFTANIGSSCLEVPKRNKRRILVVDDEHDIASLFKISLEYNGFQVETYNDPILALSNFKAG